MIKRDRNGRELRVGDRVVVIMGSSLAPLAAYVSGNVGVYPQFASVCVNDWNEYVIPSTPHQIESIEPYSTMLDVSGFETRPGDAMYVPWSGAHPIRIVPPTE